MNKAQFCSALRRQLQQLPADAVEEYIENFCELIQDRMEEGLSEEEAVATLAPPEKIAEDILLETPISTLVRTKIRGRGAARMGAGTIVLLILGSPIWLPLLLVAGVVVLSVYIVLWVLIGCLYLMIGICGLGGVGTIVFFPLFFSRGLTTGLYNLGFGLFFLGLALLLLFPVHDAARGCVRASACFGRWLKRRLIRKEAA